MNRTIYLLCKEYVRTMDLIHTIIELDIDNRERLKLFRLSQERLSLLEKELFDTLVEQDLK